MSGHPDDWRHRYSRLADIPDGLFTIKDVVLIDDPMRRFRDHATDLWPCRCGKPCELINAGLPWHLRQLGSQYTLRCLACGRRGRNIPHRLLTDWERRTARWKV